MRGGFYCTYLATMWYELMMAVGPRCSEPERPRYTIPPGPRYMGSQWPWDHHFVIGPVRAAHTTSIGPVLPYSLGQARTPSIDPG